MAIEFIIRGTESDTIEQACQDFQQSVLAGEGDYNSDCCEGSWDVSYTIPFERKDAALNWRYAAPDQVYTAEILRDYDDEG